MVESGNAPAIYSIRRPEVVSEVFEGEAVVVDLVQGRYYAFSPLASELWSRLDGGPTLDELVAASAAAFGRDETARAELTRFLGELVEAGLVRREPASSGRPPLDLEPLLDGVGKELGFETFTDLEELLVLDPIHELDENGWPLPPGRAPEPDPE